MTKTELNIRFVLKGKTFTQFEIVSEDKGIKTGKDLFLHLLAEESKRIRRIST